MIKHPGGRSIAKRRVLDEIGCGNNAPFATSATIKSMVKAGLIQKCGHKKFGNPPFVVFVDEYEMTIPTHIQWCKYHASVTSPDTEG